MIQKTINYLKLRFRGEILLLSLLLTFSQSVQSQVIQKDFEALQAFFSATGGAIWHKKEGWDTFESANPVNNVSDRWTGIKVRNNRVIEICLPSNGLTGALPDEIGNLEALNNLTIGRTSNQLIGNQITALPVSIGNLKELETLDLGYNGLTSLPPSIGNLSSLVLLDLSFNRIDYLPISFGNLSNLVILDLCGNLLEDFHDSFANLRKLVTLKLNFNALNNLPTVLTELDALENLELEENYLLALPASIGNLRKLRKLLLKRNLLYVLPASIGKLSELQVLDLNANLLHTLPESIGDLHKLRTLNLTVNNLTSLPEKISNLKSLTSLNLAFNNLRSLPASFGGLTKLKTLFLTANDLTSLPISFRSLNKLVTLKLGRNYLTTFPTFITQFSKLSILTLDDNDLTSIPSELSELRELVELDLSSNNLDTLSFSIANFKKLVILNLDENHIRALPSGISQLKNLEELYLNDNELSELPELPTGSLKILYLQNNRFDFSDLFPYESLLSDFFGKYSPQKRIPAAPSKIFLVENDTSRIYRNFEHEDNQYTWFRIKESRVITLEATTHAFLVNNPSPKDTGQYYCEIRNPNLFVVFDLETEPSQVYFVPASPSNLEVKVYPFRKKIKLNWQDNSIYESQYIVQRRVFAEHRVAQDSLPNFENIATLEPGETSYIDTEIEEEAYYEYQILMLAQDSTIFYIDTLLYSNQVRDIWRAPVKNFTISNFSCKDVRLVWEDHSELEQSFQIERKTRSEDGFKVIARVDPNRTYFVDNNTQVDVTYTYRVRPIGSHPEDTAFVSDLQEVFTEIEIIAPEQLRAKAINQSARLTWVNNPLNCEANYFVEKAVHRPELFEVIQTLNDQDTSYIDEDVEIGTQYFYRIRVGSENPAYSRIRSLLVLPLSEERRDSVDKEEPEFVLEDLESYVQLYPNPILDALHIQMKHPQQGEMELVLYNSKGHFIQSKSHAKLEGAQEFIWHLGTNNLSPGAYKLMIIWQKQTLVKTLVIHD